MPFSYFAKQGNDTYWPRISWHIDRIIYLRLGANANGTRCCNDFLFNVSCGLDLNHILGVFSFVKYLFFETGYPLRSS